MKNERTDIYTRITNQIIEAIERGAGKYRMPWHTSGEFLSSPINAQSKKPYRGINILALFATGAEHGYDNGIWATYKQWRELGAQVRKGEKSASVVFWKFSEIEAESDGGSDDRTVPFAREYHVFNANQVEGYPLPTPAPVNTEERIAHAEEFFGRVPATVSHGGNMAFYSKDTDRIQLPRFEMFKDAPSYYSVRSHETVHWTGAESRLNRDLKGRFGDESYAAEELVAELGAAFLSSELGLSNEPRQDHAAYVHGWLKVLKNDKRAIFTAASKAQQAVDWIVEQSHKESAA